MNLEPRAEPTAEPQDSPTEVAVRVDGKYLVLPSGVVMPPICVKTNQPVTDQDMEHRQLTWCSPIVGLLIVLSGFLLILVYFVVRKKCDIAFGLAPDIRRKYRTRRVLTVIAAIVLFCALPFSAVLDSTPIIIVTFLLFLASIVALFVGNCPLSVARHQRGEFWVGGFSQEYLARFQQ